MVINSNLISGKTIFNDGNKESHPLIKIIGNGDISMGINGDAFTVKGVDGYVYVDMLYCTCYKDSTNKMPYFEGDFIPLPNGESTIALIGNYTGVEITFRSEWI
jgi:phage-related protein